MRELVEAGLRGMRRAQGALPSVRELAQELGASPQTVHKVLKGLAGEGAVHALPRKGYYWGREGHAAAVLAGSGEERLLARFLGDLKQGAYHPWKELPSRKSLAQLYGAGERRVGRMLERLVRREVLERRGRGFFLASPVRSAPDATVLVVVRCDARGELILETEREIDFLRSVRRESAEQGLEPAVLGYCQEGGGRFLDRQGRESDPSRLPGTVLGALVSTWLVPEPEALLRRLARLGLPLSAWWEHPPEEFPRLRIRAGLAGFNLSFGEAAGAAVGRHLAATGRLDVAFVSPFHASDWSRARLRGLRDSIEERGGTVREFVETRHASPRHLHELGGGVEGMRRLLQRSLESFLEEPCLRGIPTWVLVNDLAAASMHRILKDRGELVPHLVGFDNTSDSERLGFDSFEFHTDGMVRQMLHHITRPEAALFAGAAVHEMLGRLVVRAPLSRRP